MALTITIPGAVEATIGATAPAVLTVGVGTPGATGPQGPAGAAGQGVPVGGTAGQFLTKIDGTNYNTDWTTVNLSAYAVKANNLSDLASASTARTNLGLGSLAVVADAPSDGSQYARKNAAWEVVTTTPDFISSVTSPLSVTTGNLTVDLSTYLPLAGGALDVNSTITGSTATVATEMGGDFFGVQLSANPSENSSLQYGGLQVQNAIGTMSVTASGLTFPNSSTQTVAFPGFNNTALTGNPTAPTPASGDNDTSIATTAYVQSAIISGAAHAETLQATVRNNTGATLSPFTVVYINGALGNKATVAKAQANTEATSSGTFAITEASIADNADGVVIAAGVLSNVDTSAYTDGDKLYLSPSVAGGVTTTKPTAPDNLVFLGVVTRSHPTLGTVNVRIQNGFELDELHDVAASTPANNDLLAYESSTSLWKNQTFSALGLLTSADAGTTYAPLASPALTGNVTITTNSASPALFITQSGAGNILQLYDQGSDTTATVIDQNGKITTILSEAANAGFNLPHGAAPTTPVNGDVWTTTGAMFYRINGTTMEVVNAGSTQTISGNKTFTNASLTLGNSTAASTINVGTGATLTATTKAINIGTNGVSGSTTNIAVGSTTGTNATTINGPTTLAGTLTASGATITVGNTTAASTLNLATGATLTATTKAVNIGTSGVAGSTTNIAIGSTTGTSTTTLQGNVTASGLTLDLGNSTATSATYTLGGGATISGATKTVNIGTGGAAGSTTTVNIGSTLNTTNVNFSVTNGTISLGGNATATTQAADTNTTALATTAYVVGQAGSATPVVNGTAAVGTSLRYARQDHVHGTDTTRAPLASPTFTGTVTIPAGASISGFAPLASPSLTGTPLSTTAAVDTNTTQIATTAYVVGQGYAKLASPTFTGTPTLPTGTIATTQTAGNNTTAVATTAFVTAAIPAYATNTQAITGTSTTTVLNPSVLNQVVMYPGYRAFNNIIGNYSQTASGTAGISVYTDYVSPYVNVANGKIMFNPSSGANVQAQSRGVGELLFDWSKPVWIAGRFGYSGSFNGDTSTTVRVTLGKTASTFGDLSTKGIGWKVLGGTASNITLMVHNGTTLTTVSTGITLSSTAVFPATTAFADWAIYSDGAGNVTMYLNGTSYATTSAGPSSGTSSQIRYAFETDNGGAPNAFCAPVHGGIKMLN